MASFALQNKDFTELYWSSEYGWVDKDNADLYNGTELDKDYCLELMEEKGGRWVSVSAKKL
jgi:hypothetical protein